MLKDITIGQYISGHSFLHKMDPRGKIIAVMLYMIALFVINNSVGYWSMIAVSIFIVLISQVPIKFFLKGLKPMVFIVILTVVLQMFMTPGEVLWQWGFLRLTREGIRQAIFMGTRLVLLVGITSVLTLTTTPIALTDGIEQLLKPLSKIGVPAHELAMMMTIALRFIPTLIEETDKIMKAQAARGADFESGNLLQRAKALIPLLVPLFLSAFKRADELAMAMEARCYRGGENRTRMKQLRYTYRDAIAVLVMAMVLSWAVASRWL